MDYSLSIETDTIQRRTFHHLLRRWKKDALQKGKVHSTNLAQVSILQDNFKLVLIAIIGEKGEGVPERILVEDSDEDYMC